MKTIILATLVFSFVCLVHSLAFSADYHVSSNGTDGPFCGSAAAPCKNLFKAIQNSGTGNHLIKMATGTYPTSFTISTSGLDLTIQGGWNESFSNQNCNTDNTLLTRPEEAVSGVRILNIVSISNAAVNVSIECLRLTSTANNRNIGVRLHADGISSTIQFSMSQSRVDSFDYHGIQIFSNNSGVINANFEDVSIKDNIHVFNHGQGGAGMRLDAMNSGDIDLSIERAYITGNSSLSDGGGILLMASSEGAIEGRLKNTIIAENEGLNGGGIYANTYIDSGSVGSIELWLTNNTITDNVANGGGGGLYFNTLSNTISAHLKNTILWGNTSTWDGDDLFQSINSLLNDDSGTDVNYSVLGEVNIISGTYTPGTHNLDSDPQFDDRYFLKRSSPAIGSGQCGWFFSSIYFRAAPYDDIAGDKRPGFGKISGCDIGADELIQMLSFPVRSTTGSVSIISLENNEN